ncbi:LUD domain-containing protein [Maribellus sp. CM-23]|uniref:LutC/YkgG family protein n=1 Tax=Maribellus sp. CM-23 TaxID=2781026 RepID=UPI001F2A0311|nr:LUD domain-containing protein [Maribellus sp. CM-23]MCE4563614.1 LUD domain-containing protein [Maribellus sp. CM-23]
MTSAREEILNRLQQATHPEPDEIPDFNTPVYFPIDQPLELAFKENLEKISGNVVLCESETDLYKRLKKFLEAFSPEKIYCNETLLQQGLKENGIGFSSGSELPSDLEAGITSCEFLIAHTGSVMVSSAIEGGRRMFVYPPVHIVIARKDQLVAYLDEAYTAIQNKYKDILPSHIALITGPSRTADIEKTLVMGAHGPRAIHVFIV